MARTRVIIEGDGPPFSDGLEKCNYCGSIGAAAWIGESIKSDFEDREGLFPYFSYHPKTGQENGLFFVGKDFEVTILQDGEEKGHWTVEMGEGLENEED